MPEEINRLVTDRLADLLLTPSRDADENLRREGIEPEKIVFVGNVMVDSLMYTLDRALSQNPAALFGASDIDYAIVTLHRPSNVDAPDRLHRICRALGELAKELRVIFPMHPRTRARLSAADHKALGSVHMIDPLAYHEMIALTSRARVAITDSGGVQEETTVLGIPCLTLRENTERPITVTEGTNQLVREPEDLLELALLRRANGQRRTPEGWDGRAGERVAAALISLP
jgi:UDP-N-acetylglucosamine 2-epimerase (non-hydrolysing)